MWRLELMKPFLRLHGSPTVIIKASRENTKIHVLCLEEGRANMGWTICRSRHTRSLWQSCTMMTCGAGKPQNPTWEEARQKVGCWRCSCWPSWALSPEGAEMMARKPPPSSAFELLPGVSPTRFSDVSLCPVAVSHMLLGAVRKDGQGAFVWEKWTQYFFHLKLFPSQVRLVPPFTSNMLGKRIVPLSWKKESLGLAWIATHSRGGLSSSACQCPFLNLRVHRSTFCNLF